MKNVDFSYSLDYNKFSKALLKEYQLEYYAIFNKLFKERREVDYFNINVFDRFFENIEDNLSISNDKDLKILISILDISSVFLDNAVDEASFESLFDSFFQLKERLEANNFL